MAVLQMQKISICALKKDRKSILELLQSSGVMELTPTVEEGTSFHKVDTSSQRHVFEKNAALADQALAILQEQLPEKTSMLSSLEGKALTDSNAFYGVVKQSELLLKDANELISLNRKAAEQKAMISKLESQIESLVPWSDLDIPMDLTGTRKTAVLVGALGGSYTLEQLYGILAEKAPGLEAMELHVISSGKDQTCIAAVVLKRDLQAMEDALRQAGFARPSWLVIEMPADYMLQLKDQIECCRQEIERTEGRIKTYGKSRENLKVLSDYFRIRAQKYEVLGTLLQSTKTFVITGYIPDEVLNSLETKLSSYEAVLEKEELAEDEETPVVLKNSRFASCLEDVVASFGLPKKGEIDPTTITSFCYIFLFGLMLSDAAYGLIVSVACFVLLRKYPRMSDGMSKAMHLFMYCGISTLFWGVLFGGYFGDAVDVVSRAFFGKEVSIPPLWFIPLDDPVRMLVYSMLFGTIHLFLGLGLKGYVCIRDRRYVDFLCDVVLWYLLLVGLIMILLPSDIFASISQMTFVFPPIVNTMAKAFAIVGAVGILLMSGRNSKNPALRVALGAYDLYNITGWLSDVLSYSRLLALGLATGVIASVINQMGSMAGGGILGAIIFAVFFVFGHLFNLAINLLGAYVHTCRLQYVEFFGKFYEGGGRPFVPFKENTKYIDIKED